MKKVIDDKERIGWGALEVIEDLTGFPAGLEHIPAHKIRLCKRERKPLHTNLEIHLHQQLCFP